MTPEMDAGFEKDREQHMGGFSASTDPQSKLMWAHYGREHRGICIQLSPYEDGLFLIARQVIYGDRFPALTVPTPPGGGGEYYLHKSSDWAYEKEWRVVVPFNSCSIVLRSGTGSAVIFGARAETTTIDAVIGLKEERERLGKAAFKIHQAELDDEGFCMRVRRFRC